MDVYLSTTLPFYVVGGCKKTLVIPGQGKSLGIRCQSSGQQELAVVSVLLTSC